jgi:phage tail sheath gpL-like
MTRRLKAATTQKLPRAKLADDGTRFGPGQPLVTPSIYKAEIIAQYRQMEFDGLVEDADAMAKATIVERNARDPSRLDVLWAPYLVSGLRIVALLNQFRLLSARTVSSAATENLIAA